MIGQGLKAVGIASVMLVGCGFAIAPLVEGAIAQEPEPTQIQAPPTEASPRPYSPLRPPERCPNDVSLLTALMMRDIPSYTNRVLQRTVAVLPWTEADQLREADGLFVRRPYRPSHVLVAGNENLTPLELSDYTLTTEPDAGGPLSQVFFTTLSRQYVDLQATDVQEYHWLFLVEATDGWRLAFMFSQIENAQVAGIENAFSPTPPRESSRSSVGQAVQLWLRDCRANAIKPL